MKQNNLKNDMRINLYEELQKIMNNDKKITYQKLIEILSNRSYGFIFLLLAIPSALPVPAPGYSTPFAIIMIILSIRMFFGKPIWIPKKYKNKIINKKQINNFLKKSKFYFNILNKITKPRFSTFINDKFSAILFFLMASLMIFPIPLTNTAPAFTIFVLSFSLLNEDGLLTLFGIICSVLATFIALGGIFLGYEFIKIVFQKIVQIINY